MLRFVLETLGESFRLYFQPLRSFRRSIGSGISLRQVAATSSLWLLFLLSITVVLGDVLFWLKLSGKYSNWDLLPASLLVLGLLIVAIGRLSFRIRGGTDASVVKRLIRNSLVNSELEALSWTLELTKEIEFARNPEVVIVDHERFCDAYSEYVKSRFRSPAIRQFSGDVHLDSFLNEADQFERAYEEAREVLARMARSEGDPNESIKKVAALMVKCVRDSDKLRLCLSS